MEDLQWIQQHFYMWSCIKQVVVSDVQLKMTNSLSYVTRQGYLIHQQPHFCIAGRTDGAFLDGAHCEPMLKRPFRLKLQGKQLDSRVRLIKTSVHYLKACLLS